MDLLYQIYAIDFVRGIVLQTRQKDQVKEASGDATQTLQTTVQNPELVLVNENAIWRDRMGWDGIRWASDFSDKLLKVFF